MESVSEQKHFLRKELLAKRSSIPSRTWQKNSEIIQHKTLNLITENGYSRIHIFVSMNERNEVNTIPLIKSLIAQKATLFIPKTNFETGKLEHAELKNFNELKRNKWGVFEPTHSDLLKNVNVDIIFIPLLAIDTKGNRLGYGKGFYDRFLQSNNALKFGLVFQEFVFDSIPTEYFDVKLDGFISEKEVRYL